VELLLRVLSVLNFEYGLPKALADVPAGWEIPSRISFPASSPLKCKVTDPTVSSNTAQGALHSAASLGIWPP